MKSNKLWELVTLSEIKIYVKLFEEGKKKYEKQKKMFDALGYYIRDDGTKSNELSKEQIKQKKHWQKLQKEIDRELGKALWV